MLESHPQVAWVGEFDFATAFDAAGVEPPRMEPFLSWLASDPSPLR